MQQLIYEYPLRTIRLDLEDREQTELEEIALAHYRSLHMELDALKSHWQACGEHLDVVKQLVKDCEVALLDMESEARRYGPIAGFPDPEVDLEPGEELTYKLKVADLIALVEAYRTVANQYNEKNRELTALYDEGMEMEKDFDETFGMFDKHYFSPIIHDHERVQLDTCRFYDDFDEFRGCCGEVMKIFDSFMDEWNAMGDEVQKLTNRMDALNPHLKKVWEVFDKSKPLAPENPLAILN